MLKNANDLLKKFQEVNNRYNARLDEQERFNKRVEKLRSDVEGVKTSLTIKISEIQRKYNIFVGLFQEVGQVRRGD